MIVFMVKFIVHITNGCSQLETNTCKEDTNPVAYKYIIT